MFAKLQLATKNEDVRVQSTSQGSSIKKSASVPETLYLESRKSFRTTPTLAIYHLLSKDMSAKVVPPKGIPEYKSDQSRHEHLPKVPLRAVVAGPSGCGKTLLIVTMITDLYRKKDGKSVFKRVYVFSPIRPRRPCLASRQEVCRGGP